MKNMKLVGVRYNVIDLSGRFMKGGETTPHKLPLLPRKNLVRFYIYNSYECAHMFLVFKHYKYIV